jgi:hypothetical protein
MTSELMLKWALGYEQRGFSVIPLSGKVCRIQWQKHQQQRATSLEIGRWYNSHLLQNIGVVCGAVSGNLVVMDCDSREACAAFEEAFPALLNTYTVFTGSGKGKHYYFRCGTLPPTTRVMNVAGGNLELRANGCYVVAPPSVHPMTERTYKGNNLPILRVNNLEAVKRWLYTFISAKREKELGKLNQSSAHPQRSVKPAPQRTMIDYHRAAKAALHMETRDVANAGEGARNNRLNVAAYNLGQLVGDGYLTYGEVEAALLNAAHGAGLPDGEAQRTIESGIQKGMAEPRSLQWKKRGQ